LGDHRRWKPQPSQSPSSITGACPPPRQAAGQFKLDRTSCPLLKNSRTRPNLRSRHQVAGLDLHEIAAPQLAVECQIEDLKLDAMWNVYSDAGKLGFGITIAPKCDSL